jgi:hypothetical protein
MLTLEHASTILTLAFSADPAVRWMYPDPHQYLKCFPRFVTLLAGKSFAHGSADALDDCPAVAAWLRPGIVPDDEAIMNLLKQGVSEDLQEDMFAFFEQMGRFHPAQPHWYLPLIGVDPAVQRAGLRLKTAEETARPLRCRPGARISRSHESEELYSLRTPRF